MTRPRRIAAFVLAILTLCSTERAGAIDPVYQEDMRRLVEIMGSLYFLEPLCGEASADWRAEAAELIVLDAPDPDREQRLYGAFNTGYQAYARNYRFCTLAAHEVMLRLFDEARQKSEGIRTRFAE
ncbi:MAG: TIGR02301 family protein [Alphaproteobacteria bacterium]|nr:TIGR02301 family protein [Alphaproteobacteria bacterium]